MATLAQLLAYRDALEAARYAGTTSVSVDRHSVSYKSDTEMAAALADLERKIAAASTGRVITIRIASSKGV